MRSPNQTIAPISAVTSVNNHNGHVKLQNRKFSVIRSVFWNMNTTSNATPISAAIAPPPSRSPRPSGALGAVYEVGEAGRGRVSVPGHE